MMALAKAEFMVQYGQHHFQGGTIVNKFGTLIVGEPNHSSDGANPASPVKVVKASPARQERVAAENEEVANAKAAKYHAYLPLEEIPGFGADDSLAVKRLFARKKSARGKLPRQMWMVTPQTMPPNVMQDMLRFGPL